MGIFHKRNAKENHTQSILSSDTRTPVASGVAVRAGCQGDFDFDGNVDGDDLLTFGASYGALSGATNFDSETDFDEDGVTDGKNSIIFGNYFGSTGCRNF